MNVIMIDIETGSTAPTAQVLQVGFVAADTATGEILIPKTNMWVKRQLSGHMDPDTLSWWAAQDLAIRDSVWNESGAEVAWSPETLFAVLKDTYDFLGAGTTVWASPAMFDLPILTNMWGNKKPWPYYQERDLMTLYKMLDPDKQHKPANPAEHDAASDAYAQLLHLLAIFKHNPVLQGAK